MRRPQTLVRTCALLALAALTACQDETKPAAGGPPPPPKVFFTKVVRQDIPLYLEAVASIDGYVNADIRARARGYLKTQDYKDGAVVKANQRLFTVEPAEFEAAVSSAKAALGRARAAQERSRLQLARSQSLFTSGAVAQSEIDNATTGMADADAQVQGAQAQLEQAQLSLSYTKIFSPIDGVAGAASVRVGDLVGQDGPTLLTTVSQIDPIRVNFPISELDYVKQPQRFQNMSRRDLAWAKKQFSKLDAGGDADNNDPGVELVLSDGSVFAHRGVIVTVSRQIDASTGTIQLQALVPNPDGFLRPGQYGRVRVRRQNEGKNALSVPDRALILVQGTYSVGVLGPDDKVQLRRVEVGAAINGTRLIDKGLAEGDRVVVDGVQKISDGAKVVAEPAPEQTASAANPNLAAPAAAPAAPSGASPAANGGAPKTNAAKN
jgi:membrane fusion protein, multidrug efflux system